MPDRTYRGNPAPGGSAGNGEGESLSFILPGGFPPGVNKLYDINHLSRSVRLTDQAALWKTRIIPFVKPCRWPEEWLLKLELVYESDRWLCKNGRLRRIDLDGFLKLTIDAMFSKWGWDDSRLVEITSSKAYGPREQIRVRLERAQLDLKGGNVMAVVDGTQLYHDAIRRIQQLEQQSAELAAQVDRQGKVVEAAIAWVQSPRAETSDNRLISRVMRYTHEMAQLAKEGR